MLFAEFYFLEVYFFCCQAFLYFFHSNGNIKILNVRKIIKAPIDKCCSVATASSQMKINTGWEAN